jgi:hypothetical protein
MEIGNCIGITEGLKQCSTVRIVWVVNTKDVFVSGGSSTR